MFELIGFSWLSLGSKSTSDVFRFQSLAVDLDEEPRTPSGPYGQNDVANFFAILLCAEVEALVVDQKFRKVEQVRDQFFDVRRRPAAGQVPGWLEAVECSVCQVEVAVLVAQEHGGERR